MALPPLAVLPETTEVLAGNALQLRLNNNALHAGDVELVTQWFRNDTPLDGQHGNSYRCGEHSLGAHARQSAWRCGRRAAHQGSAARAMQAATLGAHCSCACARVCARKSSMRARYRIADAVAPARVGSPPASPLSSYLNSIPAAGEQHGGMYRVVVQTFVGANFVAPASIEISEVRTLCNHAMRCRHSRLSSFNNPHSRRSCS